MILHDIITRLRPAHGILAGARHESGATFEVHDPATTQVIADVADGTAEHALLAVDAASTAFPLWSARAPRERAEILRRAYDLMITHSDMLVSLICAENGKPRADATAEVTYAAEFFRWYSEEAVRTEGAYGLSPSGAARTIVTHKPVGIAALITPWNFPAAMAARKIAPALAAGCAVVLKPAAETPLTALALCGLLAEAGAPEGVVNLVPTTDADTVVTAWLQDERIRKVSFTGSTPVGRLLLRRAADRIVNASMELGGNAPFVVTADADIDAAVHGAMIAKFRGGGQACTAANRFFVHTAVLDEFTDRFGTAIAALTVGPATDADSQIGPLVSAAAARRVTQLIDDAVAEGAVIARQTGIPQHGWYVAPTLLTQVRPDAPIVAQETFGPVAPVVVWDDELDLLSQINRTEHGLAAYVYAGRLQTALRIAEGIDAGMVGINRGVVSDPSAPFGGTKQSGLGREGGRDGIREFQETQYFSVAMD